MAIFISIVVIISFAVFSAIMYFMLANTFFNDIVRDNSENSQIVASNIGVFVENAYNLTQELALNSDVTSMDPETQQKLLDSVIQRYPLIDNLSIIKTADGWQTARAKGEITNLSQRWWFKKMLTDNSSFVSKDFFTLSTQTAANYAVTSIYYPIYKDHDFVGIFATNFKMGFLKEYVRRLNGDTAGRYSYVLDSEGTVIAHPDNRQVAEMYNYKTAQKTLAMKDATGKPIVEAGYQKLEDQAIVLPVELQRIAQLVLQGNTGTAEYIDLDGKSILCSYAPITLPGSSGHWAVITVQDKGLAMAPVQKIFIAIVFIALIIVIGLIIIILRRMKDVRMVNTKLSDANRELENARQQVVASNVQLQEINASLEEEISERCKIQAELSAVNESMQDTNQNLLAEIMTRQAAEDALVLRERQCRAITSLIVKNPDSPENLLRTILSDALNMVDAPVGFIALTDENEHKVTVAYVKGDIYQMDEQFSLDQGLFSIVYSTGQLLYVADYRAFLQRINKQSLARVTSAVMLPLKCGNQVIGMFAAAWLDRLHQVNQDNLDALQQFADLVAVTLENAQTRTQIQQLAYQDALTGFPNRASLNRRLTEEMEQDELNQACGCLMFVDMDDLKTVNDTYGHNYGDDVICAVGKHIAQAMGAGSYVARLGGDEFVVLLSGEHDSARIHKIADHLLEILTRDYVIGEDSIHLSASIGIAVYPEDGTTAGDILKNADSAMYAAKQAGKNCWRFYETSMQTETYERMVLTNSLRHAIERDEFTLHYQPQVDEQGKIVSYEALLRWNSHEFGSVSPERFISLAEQSGLIMSIGQWVLQTACRFARKLAEVGRQDCKVSANVSPRQLADDHFETIVRDAIIAAGIEPSQLVIEITESVLLGSVEESIQKLERLRNLGVGASLDDFGTGFSSLTYLQQLPVQELKIDRSFIESVLEVPVRKTLVRSIIEMAHALNLRVVAEGVETCEQWDFLVSCQCDLAQGYLFSRPLPESEVLQKLPKDA
jgi:diguanylate cyclase (GGDEF)-like protein